MSDPNQSLVAAIQAVDPVAVQEALDLGADPNQPIGIAGAKLNDVPPLTHMCANQPTHPGTEAVIKVLLAHPCTDVNATGPEVQAFSAIQWAANIARPDMKVLQLLLNHPDIDVNQRDADGKTALFVYNPNYDSQSESKLMLLEHGADPCLVDGRGRSALELAAMRDSAEAVSVLLSHGANPLIGDTLRAAGEGLVDLQPVDAALKLNLLEEAMGTNWHDGVPSLYHQCIWKLKRMRSKLDEEYMVNFLPDAMVWEHFRWKGALKWCIPWLEAEPELLEQAKREMKEWMEAGCPSYDSASAPWRALQSGAERELASRQAQSDWIREQKARVQRRITQLEVGLMRAKVEAAGLDVKSQWVDERLREVMDAALMEKEYAMEQQLSST